MHREPHHPTAELKSRKRSRLMYGSNRNSDRSFSIAISLRGGGGGGSGGGGSAMSRPGGVRRKRRRRALAPNATSQSAKRVCQYIASTPYFNFLPDMPQPQPQPPRPQCYVRCAMCVHVCVLLAARYMLLSYTTLYTHGVRGFLVFRPRATGRDL